MTQQSPVFSVTLKVSFKETLPEAAAPLTSKQSACSTDEWRDEAGLSGAASSPVRPELL